MKDLVNESFGLEFDLRGERTTVERSGSDKSKLYVSGSSFLGGKTKITNTEWLGTLGEQMFGLDAVQDGPGRTPLFDLFCPTSFGDN